MGPGEEDIRGFWFACESIAFLGFRGRAIPKRLRRLQVSTQKLKILSSHGFYNYQEVNPYIREASAERHLRQRDVLVLPRIIPIPHRTEAMGTGYSVRQEVYTGRSQI